MKATIEIPDDLYRRVKAKSALQGMAVREVTLNLFSGWLEEGEAPVTPASRPEPTPTIPAWFGAARKHARRVSSHDMQAVRRSIATGRAKEARS